MPASLRKRQVAGAVGLIAGALTAAAATLYWNRLRKAEQLLESHRSGADSSSRAPKPGDILLFYDARGIDRLITGFTGSPFYHVALYAGSQATVEATTPGVMLRDLRDRKEPYIVIPAPAGKGKAALEWAKTQIGDSYDNLDIAIIVLDRLCRFVHFNYTPGGRYSCGEFVAMAFDQAGIRLFEDRDLNDVVPGDFARFAPAASSTKKRVRSSINRVQAS